MYAQPAVPQPVTAQLAATQQSELITLLEIENGVLTGFKNTVSAGQIAEYRNFVIPSEISGEPVIQYHNRGKYKM